MRRKSTRSGEAGTKKCAGQAVGVWAVQSITILPGRGPRLRSRSCRCCRRVDRGWGDRDRFSTADGVRSGVHGHRRNRLDHFAPAVGAPCLDPLVLTFEHRWNRLELFDVAHAILRHHKMEPETIRISTGVGQHPIGTAPEHVAHDLIYRRRRWAATDAPSRGRWLRWSG
jgi:hypothetical protein